MRSIAAIGTGIVVALLLCAGLIAVDNHLGGLSASAGGALTAGVLAAFLLTYDMLKRDGAAGVTGGGKREVRGRAPVRPSVDPDDVTLIAAASKDGTKYMSGALDEIDRGTVYILKLTLSPRIPYGHDALIEQLAVLSTQFRPDAYVYCVTPEGKFAWFARADVLKRQLEGSDGRSLVALINNGPEDEFRLYKYLVRFQVPRRLSNLAALRLLASKGVSEGMIVHEARGTPVGPIDWATLVTRALPGESGTEISE